jgi:Cu2+-exporting ATPase
MKHHHHTDTPAKMPTMDHSKMNHSTMQHGGNLSMGMEGDNHHAMMIADFKKRFYVVQFYTRKAFA